MSGKDKPGVWRDLREECRAALDEAIGEWRELVAGIREQRQMTRRMWQRITGKPDPTRRERRRAGRVITAETEELEEIERSVLREQREAEGPEAAGRNPE